MLLNLTAGRNPWKATAPSDSTFRIYLHIPHHCPTHLPRAQHRPTRPSVYTSTFLITVLPISPELNTVLLHIALQGLTDFYAAGAVFEANMVWCPWEVRIGLEAVVQSRVEFAYPDETSDTF
ncbi:hypothetical protein B0H17DRAFT_1197313 [Mycena rosella]|uniref:Uncharacterized protein n=1 Tax=Mycena rosella TaxID=1033263 RepID=A0AAD7DT07_MYCRO|nr:hypothetical protein B0H17DRAFT_1197313 [Mycena rosella]